MPEQSFTNRVLASLPSEEIDRLRPHLSPMTFKVRQQLLKGQANYAYFLEEGLASVVLSMQDGASVEVDVIGNDGVVGLPMLLGANWIPGETFVQVAGFGFRIDAQFLRQEFERLGNLRNYVHKYMLGSLIHMAQNAACNRLHPIAARLAKWLLTYHDRLHSERMPLTHDFMGHMLGAPRSTVTLAAGMLQHAGLIDYSRGHVTIKDRAKMEDAACECYRVVCKEFRRLGLL